MRQHIVTAVVGVLLAASTPASAEILNLDCYPSNNPNSTIRPNYWVDFGNNTITSMNVRTDRPQDTDPTTYPAEITPTRFQFKPYGWLVTIDRTTGKITWVGTTGNAYQEQSCSKGSRPLPPPPKTKF
jgi:hypothetical protein